MITLAKNISSLVTVNTDGKNYKAGREMQEVGEIKNGAVIFDDKILWTGTTADAEQQIISGVYSPDRVIDCSGKTVVPGFVDSHTHLVFSGDRSGEFAKRLRGVTYQQIAEEGGGIICTVKGTRSATFDELYDNARKLILSALSYGTTSFEIKSGYGLTTESELKSLEVIKKLKDELPVEIIPTFLGAHDFPPEFKDDPDKYVELICSEMLPKVAGAGLAEYCDAFIDKGYYTLAQGRKIFETAKELGLKIRVHADELADAGAAGLAADIGAVSADHLLFVSDGNIKKMKNAGTIATLLPGTAYFIRMPYAPARKLIEAGVTVALATDCNPGSCFTENMQMILSLAVINMKMTAEEALSAATINSAASIGINDKTGSLEQGKLADLLILNIPSYTSIFYHFGINHVDKVFIKGKEMIF